MEDTQSGPEISYEIRVKPGRSGNDPEASPPAPARAPCAPGLLTA